MTNKQFVYSNQIDTVCGGEIACWFIVRFQLGESRLNNGNKQANGKLPRRLFKHQLKYLFVDLRVHSSAVGEFLTNYLRY